MFRKCTASASGALHGKRKHVMKNIDACIFDFVSGPQPRKYLPLRFMAAPFWGRRVRRKDRLVGLDRHAA
jgi:hypothetical protein